MSGRGLLAQAPCAARGPDAVPDARTAGAVLRRRRGGAAVRWLAPVAVLALGACGVDGPPHQKGRSVEVSGEARIGVVGRL